MQENQKSNEEIIQKLKEDAEKILKDMTYDFSDKPITFRHDDCTTETISRLPTKKEVNQYLIEKVKNSPSTKKNYDTTISFFKRNDS